MEKLRLMEKDPIVTTLYQTYREWTHDTFNPSTLITLITLMIPQLEKIVVGPNRGEYKKKIIISVLDLLVGNSNLDENAKDSLYLVIKTTIPITIDTMISVAHGDIDLGKELKKIQNCCATH